MRGTQGTLIVASTLQIVVGFSGLWRNVVRFLSPLSAVPLVALSGFGLYELGFPVNAELLLKPLNLNHPVLSKTVLDKFAALGILQVFEKGSISNDGKNEEVPNDEDNEKVSNDEDN
ncbi:hypothetical protein VIGAN_08099400 [Vigna angularis var. angularis]|uniref:Uncharacterized protein n=1 Tax=Vigna angularis var. angularis TaxID=157739 RepID=A0A0S3SNR3_PHAAN|nr:hypothetical protein VIGAN_08099400 [Vigna angularis var. angularis]